MAVDLDVQRKTMAILRVINQYGPALGSSAISRHLAEWGLDLRERMVRNYLAQTDVAGLTENLGRRGRCLTDRGRKELELGIAIDRVGFVASRVDELAYKMTFDPGRQAGSIIVNASLVAQDRSLGDSLGTLGMVMRAGLGTGQRLMVVRAGQRLAQTVVPEGQVAVNTVCSVTLNGALLRYGIAMTSRFGGLLELRDGTPVRFRHIIHYDGSTLDPLVVFIRGKMTDVRGAARTGTGVIGASFREIPTVSLPAAQAVVKKLDRMGLGGVLMVGKPNRPVLDIPVSAGRVGVIVAGGLNPIAALAEMGMSVESTALHSLCEFDKLTTVEAALKDCG